MEAQLKKLRETAIFELDKIDSLDKFRELEIKILGRKGELAEAMKRLAALSTAEKKIIGNLANEIKRELQEKFSIRKAGLEKAGSQDSFIDVTLPGEEMPRGHLHPITQIMSDLEDLFVNMGFMVLDGPELESDFYNFTALNIPPYHPARDSQDTFYIDHRNAQNEYDLVMRTHTSPMQIRAMRKYGAPLSCIVPGRVFRNEATDACHENTFYQLEGLMIGQNISVGNLVAVMKEALAGIFKQEVKVRVRPGYFPFVEPGLELDMSCTICGGRGCPACKQSGWLEMFGSGMVHPEVLKYGRIDPEKYNGFAFGLGVTRLAMMLYGIEDIRLFNSGDLRFLEQF